MLEPAEEDKMTEKGGGPIGKAGDEGGGPIGEAGEEGGGPIGEAGEGFANYSPDMLTRIVKNQNHKPRKCRGRRCNSG